MYAIIFMLLCPVTKTRGWGSFEFAMRKDDHFSKATSNKPDPHSESTNGLAQTGVQNTGGPPYYSPCIFVIAYMFPHDTCYVKMGLNKFDLI